jgi:hypothetical protein
METLANLFYPFYQPVKPINPLRYVHLKWVCVKLFIGVTLSYLMGAYKVFLIILPLYILATLYFSVIITMKNKEFFIQSGFGDSSYRNLSQEKKAILYEGMPEKIKIVSWILWILHIIPLIIFMIWLDKIRKGHVQLGSDDPWLYIRKNNLLIALITIGVSMVFILTLPNNLYGVDGSYYIFSMPILLLAIVMLMY